MIRISQLPGRALTMRSHLSPTYLIRSFSTYGAPFTNSIKCLPLTDEKTGNKQIQYNMTIPDLPSCTINIDRNSTFERLGEMIQKYMDVSNVRFLINGRYVTKKETLVSSCIGSCLDIEIDQVRYNVNEGGPISESGRTFRKSKFKSYSLVVSGASVLLVACVVWWRTVLPKEHQKRLT